MTVSFVYEGANMLLNTAQHHCQANQTIIDRLTENKSNTELRLLLQRSPGFSPGLQVVLTKRW